MRRRLAAPSPMPSRSPRAATDRDDLPFRSRECTADPGPAAPGAGGIGAARRVGPGGAGQVGRDARAALEHRHAQRIGAVAPVEEELAQRARDGPERELFPRDLVLPEQAHLEALRARSEVAAGEARPEHHVDLADVGQADHRVEIVDVDARARLLERLARRALLERFAVLHESRGEGPQAAPRFDRAAAEQDLLAGGHEAADDDLRIAVEDRAAGEADVARRVVAFRHPPFDPRRAAVAAVLHASTRRNCAR